MYEYFQKLLDEYRVSAAEVSRATGIPQGTLSTWKKRNSHLSIEYLEKIANYFGVSIDYFVDGKRVHYDFITDEITEEEVMQQTAMRLFAKLDENDKEATINVMKGFLNTSKYKKDIMEGSEVG